MQFIATKCILYSDKYNKVIKSIVINNRVKAEVFCIEKMSPDKYVTIFMEWLVCANQYLITVKKIAYVILAS